ncbi:uncharacterized protein N7496_012227 [Penicillium cataractarum]|uniref:Myb-like domain-containing protein n=1 Tax=Penicillium cataractarum TaxID=2100454 RepID=A0A9W9UTM7_9EURO|nr:uncharacterized protein N7496_012227 [Penicillium cataractarum]KAJ5355015.1 hypothetical protein N7496_012227 [Penicillium cataractarum]
MDDHDPLNDTLDRPTKRPRLSFTPDSPEDAEQVSGEWDLQAARAQNDLRLKSIFEGIFAKYGNDFSEVGDEIDLETGEIVVNNGHLQGMHEETDIGNKEKPWETDPFGSGDEASAQDEEELVESHDHASGRSPQTELLGSGTDGDASVSFCDSAVASSGLGPGIPASSPSVLKEKPSSALHHIEKDPGPRDPLWQAPELPPLFTTPKVDKRHANVTPQLPNIPRQPSPPGSGSLWTVPRRRPPQSSKHGKVIATPTPSKSRSRAKRKHQSSPVARDWSFAKVADDDESDDPLQEEWPSSPLPFPRQINITSKRDLDSQIKPADETLHAESVIITSRVDASRESPTQADPSVHDQSGIDPEQDGQGDHSERSLTTTDVPLEYHNLQCDLPSPVSPHSQTVAHSPLKYSLTQANTKFSPDDIKLIVCMRYVQERTWKEVLGALPGRTLTQIYQWNQVHWSDRRACPPELSVPWTQAELEILESLAGRTGLSWPEIMGELSERSQSEVEFELLRRWAGDEIWEGEQRDSRATAPDPALSASVQYETENKVIKINPGDDEDGETRSETSATAVEDHDVEEPTAVEEHDVELPPPREHRQFEFEDLVDSDDAHGENENDEVMLSSGASSPSKLSAILLDSPMSSRYGSVTPKKSPFKRRSFI